MGRSPTRSEIDKELMSKKSRPCEIGTKKAACMSSTLSAEGVCYRFVPERRGNKQSASLHFALVSSSRSFLVMCMGTPHCLAL